MASSPSASRRRIIINVGLVAFSFFFFIQVISFLSHSSSLSTPAVGRSYTDSENPFEEIPGGWDSIQFRKHDTKENPHSISDEILVLTPLRNAERHLPLYFKNILEWTYPHDKISLGFLVSDSNDNTLYKLQSLAYDIQTTHKLEQRFKNITILTKNFDTDIGQDEKERHSLQAQIPRRKIMAKARNYLLNTLISVHPNVKWILWLDGDVIETPNTLLSDLMAHDKDVIVPNCFQRFEGGVRPYDFNSWVDSPTAKEMGNRMGEDEVIFEGYAEMATYRGLFGYMYNEGGDPKQEMQLDGVGGTAILLKAEVHRQGVYFGMVPMWHLLETEAFAKM